MNCSYSCLFIFTVLLPLFTQAQTVKQTEVNFKIKNLGIMVNGGFTNIITKVDCSDADKSKWILDGTVQAGSIYTGNDLRDNHLKEKKQFFYIQSFPVINMKAVNIDIKEPNLWRVQWELNMKNIKKRFFSNVKVKDKGNERTFESTFSINRRDWEVGENSITMSDVVTVTIRCVIEK